MKILTINLHDTPLMNCLYFRVGRITPLKQYMNKLYSNASLEVSKKDKSKYHKVYESALKYSILQAAFDYMSRCKPSQFTKILMNSNVYKGIKCDKFLYVDPITLEPEASNGFTLVKKIVVDINHHSKLSPIFELRINRINVINTDFGFRCIFFKTTHTINNSSHEFQCQCFTNYFHKRKYNRSNYRRSHHRRSGNQVTNYFGNEAYSVYNCYRMHPKRYTNEFMSNNLISGGYYEFLKENQ